MSGILKRNGKSVAIVEYTVILNVVPPELSFLNINFKYDIKY